MSITQAHPNKWAECQRGTDVLDTSWHELKAVLLDKKLLSHSPRVVSERISLQFFVVCSVFSLRSFCLTHQAGLISFGLMSFPCKFPTVLLLFGVLAALIHSSCALLSEYITEYNKNRIFPAVRADLIWVKSPWTFFQLCCGVSNHE